MARGGITTVERQLCICPEEISSKSCLDFLFWFDWIASNNGFLFLILFLNLGPQTNRRRAKPFHKPHLYSTGTGSEARRAGAFSGIYREETCRCESCSDLGPPAPSLVNAHRPAGLQGGGGRWLLSAPLHQEPQNNHLAGVQNTNDSPIFFKLVLYLTTSLHRHL